MVAIKMQIVKLEENALTRSAEKETTIKTDLILNIVQRTTNVALAFVLLKFQNVPLVFHLAQNETVVKNSNTRTKRVTVTKIVKPEVIVTKWQVSEIHVAKTKASKIVPMVNFVTIPSNVLLVDVANTFAKPKFQTDIIMKVTTRIVNPDTTISTHVFSAKHIVTVQTGNNATVTFAELLFTVLVNGVDVSEIANTNTKFTQKQEMQVSEVIIIVQELVTKRIAILSGQHVQMDGVVVGTMDVRVVFVILENANENLILKT